MLLGDNTVEPHTGVVKCFYTRGVYTFHILKHANHGLKRCKNIRGFWVRLLLLLGFKYSLDIGDSHKRWSITKVFNKLHEMLTSSLSATFSHLYRRTIVMLGGATMVGILTIGGITLICFGRPKPSVEPLGAPTPQDTTTKGDNLCNQCIISPYCGVPSISTNSSSAHRAKWLITES